MISRQKRSATFAQKKIGFVGGLALSDLRITAYQGTYQPSQVQVSTDMMMMIFHPCSMHGLMLSQTCMHRGYLTNKPSYTEL